MAIGKAGARGGTGSLGVLGTQSKWVPPLDGISNIYAAVSPSQLLTTYTGPVLNLRRDSDNAVQDFYATDNGWASKSAILAWLNGATAFLAKAYDQSGNARDFSPASTAAQPTINLLGAHPVIQHDGSTQEIDVTTQLAAFSQNQGGASIIAVRRYSNIAVSDRQIAYVSTATAGATRMAMGLLSGGNFLVGLRRVDADALVRTTGFTPNTSWATQIGRWDWTNNLLKHQLDAQSESRAGTTSGLTSNTASTRVMVGSTGAGNYFAGEWSMVAFVQRAMSDAEVAALI